METLERFFGELAGLLWGNWLLAVLLGLGIFYTLLTGGIQFRCLPYFIRHVKELGRREHGKKKQDAEGDAGALSSIQALFVAVASCVGSGNIVGVSTALISGGPGALFWMWIAAFFGMATKYGEIILGIHYREQDETGRYTGGPMYYIGKGLRCPWLGVAAAILLFIQNAGATLIQSNTISSVMLDVFRVPKLLTGIVLAAAMFHIISGGLRRMASIAEKVVPLMAGLYVVGGIVVILFHMDAFIPVWKLILSQAFSLEAQAGALAGLSIKEAMRFGIARGLYSNEAGEGSAAVIYSAANAKHPSIQGFYGVLDVFVDTIVICSTTGLVILSSGISLEGANAATLAANAFGTVFPAFRMIVSVSLILFASTSVMSQWYFGHVSLVYLKSSGGDRFYRHLFPVLILCGSLSTTGLVWSIQDCMLGLLVIPNILALILLSPEVRRSTKEFFKQQKLK